MSVPLCDFQGIIHYIECDSMILRLHVTMGLGPYVHCIHIVAFYKASRDDSLSDTTM